MRVTDKYVIFWGSIFSQWFTTTPYQFIEDNLEFVNCEQYMMYKKAMLFNDSITAYKIMCNTDSKIIKQLGREVKNFDSVIWDKNKYSIVLEGNKLKFTQNKQFAEEMKKYNGKVFVEGSPYDKVWGIGLHYKDELALDSKNWQGQNLLGKALTEVSKIIK